MEIFQVQVKKVQKSSSNLHRLIPCQFGKAFGLSATPVAY